MKLFSEPKRHNVFRMGALSIVPAWLIVQVADAISELASLPGWVGLAILSVLAAGFPIALVLSWFHEPTPEGLAIDSEDANWTDSWLSNTQRCCSSFSFNNPIPDQWQPLPETCAAAVDRSL